MSGTLTGKDRREAENNGFVRHGFVYQKDLKKRIQVTVNEARYQFAFETNTIFEIPSVQVKFAVTVRSGKRLLFINQEWNLSHGATSPYRAFYSGLMKEPFRYCCPFDESVIIETKDGDQLRFFVSDRG